jgi:type IV secretory pathway VirB2 component (pilin)
LIEQEEGAVTRDQFERMVWLARIAASLLTYAAVMLAVMTHSPWGGVGAFLAVIGVLALGIRWEFRTRDRNGWWA